MRTMTKCFVAGCLALALAFSGTASAGDSIDLIINAAKSGDAESQFFLSKLYETGAGDVKKDSAKAAYWLKQAAEAGNLDARCEVAVHYLNGTGGYPQDKAKALAMLQENTQKKHPASMRELGRLYDMGLAGLVTQDEHQALEWFKKAADADDSRAAVYLGYYYETGKGGLKQDYGEAVTWYQKGVSQLEPMAMNNLGVMYYHGKGVARDLKEAKRWWQMAVKFGSQEAKRNLEILEKERTQ